MTRIPENQISQSLLLHTQRNRELVDKFSQEVSTGLKVRDPGDSTYAGTISQMRNSLEEIEGQKSRISIAMGYFEHQDSAYAQMNEVLTRAMEIAAQVANESNSQTERDHAAKEVLEIREQVISLANSQYLGRYIFAGAADASPAYSPDGANAFTSPGDGSLVDTNYVYSTSTGSTQTRTVPITDEMSVEINENGSSKFDNAVRSLTELARSLSGHRTVWTTTSPPVPDNAQSTAYNFPTDFHQQTQDIQAALDAIESAREGDIIPARTSVAGKMRRLQSAESLLDLSETSAKDILNKLQDADVIESATNLTEAQSALSASLTVTTQLLRQSILDYI